MVTLLRRVFWLAVIGGAGFAAWSAWSRRNTAVTAGPPEWPPIEPPAPSSQSGALTWVASDAGACPPSHPIKANSNSGIFHVPGGRFYNQTRAERCYALADDAEADGYRRAKS
jgi:hypothetical protein